VKVIPTLVSDSGKRLESEISEEQLESFWPNHSKRALEASILFLPESLKLSASSKLDVANKLYVNPFETFINAGGCSTTLKNAERERQGWKDVDLQYSMLKVC
jgi:hypothetical protein